MDHMKEHDRKLREARKAEEKRQATAFRQLLEASPFIKVHRSHSPLVSPVSPSMNQAAKGIA